MPLDSYQRIVMIIWSDNICAEGLYVDICNDSYIFRVGGFHGRVM
jgi:hypothetical protein